MRLLNETHSRLMRGVRGAEKLPGEVRRSQNWIGGSRPGNAAYVPPPPQALGEVLGAFEKYMHADDALPPLVRAGLLHVQFETIHPYLDGNGRIGRLLVTLLLEHWKLLTKPLLYLSLFFKRHRDDYYRRLNAVRIDGDWEGWLDFFLDGVATIADEAVASARDLFALVAADRARVLAHEGMSVVALRLFELLPRHPVVTVASAMKLVETTKPTAGRAIELLVAARRSRRDDRQEARPLLRVPELPRSTPRRHRARWRTGPRSSLKKSSRILSPFTLPGRVSLSRARSASFPCRSRRNLWGLGHAPLRPA
jgi:Fic family protein